MNANRYGKNIRLQAFGSVFAEVWRDEGDYHISIQRRTFGSAIPWFNNEERNFKDAHAWADAKIVLVAENETTSKRSNALNSVSAEPFR